MYIVSHSFFASGMEQFLLPCITLDPLELVTKDLQKFITRYLIL